jgi:arsenate reductase (glutaredoxin)
MTVLVDPAVWSWRGRRWAHMVSDESLGELHAFAERLGLPPQAFHDDHYDVPTELREEAVALGAVAVDGRELVRRLRAAGLRRRRPSRAGRAPYHQPMADLTVFHNPRCSNSRKAVEALESRGVAFDTVLYLKQPPSRDDLERIASRLDGDVTDLVRRDARFTELGLDRDGYRDATAVVDLLVEHPELMQRPVIETADKAVIARPPEATVAALFGDA